MNRPIKGQQYKHFKGSIITIIEVGKNTETEEEMVVYEHSGNIWIRPMDMFLSKVDKDKYPAVLQEYRFELIQ